jgi:hypothetical protein
MVAAVTEAAPPSGQRPDTCPEGFEHAGRDPSGFWTLERRQTGACNGQTDFPDAIRETAFCFSGEKGGIDVDLARVSGASTEGCMSFASSCDFSKDAVEELQFRASVTGCYAKGSGEEAGYTVWAAPLWAAPLRWGPTQATSGEVDFLERCGTEEGQGIAMNFGQKLSPDEPGGEKRSFTVPQPDKEWTYFVRFDNPSHGGSNVDGVTMYQCPPGADPLRDGLTNECKEVGTGDEYFARTKGALSDTLVFVTDIWNNGSAQAGDCSAHAPFSNKSCRYRVGDLAVKFRDDTWAGDPVCASFAVPKRSCGLKLGGACFEQWHLFAFALMGVCLVVVLLALRAHRRGL